MSHPDVDEIARALASGGLGGTPKDEKGLADLLYLWYLNATPFEPVAGTLHPFELDLANALRAAHHDATHFEGGWRAERVSTRGRVVASKGELTRVLDRCEYLVPTRAGLRAEPGDPLLVSRYWGWTDEESGFWHGRRGAWPPPGADRLIRVYWNVAPATTARILHELSTLLAREPEISYMVKTPARPERTGRADALVLYLGPQGYTTFEPSVRELAESLEGWLRSPTPRFTQRLSAGLAMAEGALDGGSFGESRCLAVARAFLASDAEERRHSGRLSEHISAAFTAAGLDPDRPHLEPAVESVSGA